MVILCPQNITLVSKSQNSIYPESKRFTYRENMYLWIYAPLRCLVKTYFKVTKKSVGLTFGLTTYLWDKVFKNGPSKICGRQPLKNLKRYGLLKADRSTPYPFEFFKGCLHKFYLVHSWILCTIYNGTYLFKVKNGNIKTMCDICSKLTIVTPERHWGRAGVFYC